MNVETLNLQELSLCEQRETEGGFFWAPVIGALIGSALTNWSDIEDGISVAWNGKPNRHH